MDIVRFKYRDYELALRMDAFGLVYIKIKDGKKDYAVSLEEKLLIDYVLKKVMPDKKIKFKYDLVYKEKKYAHFLSQNNYHLFYEINDNGLKEANKEVKPYFNYLYNNQKDYVASASIEKDRYFKRIIKIGKLFLVVFVSTTLLYSYNYINKAEIRVNSSSPENIISNTDNITFDPFFINEDDDKVLRDLIRNSPQLWNKEIIFNINGTDISIYYDSKTDKLITKIVYKKDLEKQDLTVDEIITLINDNSNLSKKEKGIFLSNIDFFYDNISYFNPTLVRETLKDLKIIYEPNQSKEKNDAEYYNAGALAHTIIIYNSQELNEYNISYLLHEFLHTFTNVANLENGVAFYECLNAMATNEYYKTDYDSYTILDSSYSWIMPEARMLCEILDDEVIKNFYFSCNEQVIIDYLVKVIPDPEMALDLLRNIDALNNLYKDYDYDLEIQIKSEIKKAIKSYYEAKNNRSISECEEIMFWWDNENFIRHVAESLFDNDVVINLAPYYNYIANYKHYFNNKDQYKNTQIAICTTIDAVEHPISLDSLLAEGAVIFKNGKYIILDNYMVKQKEDGTYVRIDYSAQDNYLIYTLEDDLLEYGDR